MAKQGTSTAVPRLRFPEFGNAWVADCVGNLGSFIGGGTPDKSVEAYWDGNIPWVSSSDLAEDNIYDLKVSRHITPAAVSASATKVVPKGSLLFVSRVGVGKVAIADRDLCTSQDFTNFLPVRLLNSFVAYFFVANKWILKSFGQGTSIKGFAKDDLASFKLQFPELAEQQKIADCLTSLDEVIAAQGRIVAALKAHKRGLMQQLFPREGETRPRLRFPEFRDAPEWNSTLLGEVTLIVRGGSPRPIDAFLSHAKNGLNWLKIGDVDREAKYITKTEERVRPEALAKTRMIQAGDFILSNSMSFGRPYISVIETCIHDGWIAVTEIPNGLSREFLYYSILSDKSQRYFANRAAGSGVQNLNKDIIKLLPVEIPPKEEQQRVADCLSSLDDQITAESNQLAVLKTHKQGLMQQLFPSREVVAA